MTLPTKSFVRLWAPCVSMLLLSLLSFADRSVLVVLSPTILGDLHMTATQYGYAVSAFSVCYMLGNPIWGIWIDRRGMWVVVVAVLLWSAASGAHALMGGLVSMCIVRGVLGFGEGATFPAGLAMVADTLPAEKQSVGLALAYSGMGLGLAMAPLVITPVAMRYGWRPTFVITAALGLVWILIWGTLQASGAYPAGTTVRVAAKMKGAPRWNRGLFATAGLYGLGILPMSFGLYAVPLYLSRAMHLDQASVGHLLWIPPAGWEVGYLFWGRIADRRRARGAGRPTGLFAAFAAAGFVSVLAPFADRTPHPVMVTMAIFFVETFIAGGFVVLSLSDGMDAQRKQDAGFLAGFSISCGALATGMLIPMLGHFYDLREFTRGFWLVAALPVVGVVWWWLLRGRMKSAV